MLEITIKKRKRGKEKLKILTLKKLWCLVARDFAKAVAKASLSPLYGFTSEHVPCPLLLESLMMTNLGLQYTKMILSENFT
jgi:hypothetical protein